MTAPTTPPTPGPSRAAFAFIFITVTLDILAVGITIPVAGELLGEVGLRVPFWTAGMLSLIGTAYGWFVLPESLPSERRAPFRLARANPLGALALLRARPALLGMAIAAFLYRLGHDVMPSFYVVYVDYRYGWDPRTVGLSLAALGFASIIVQAGLVGRVARSRGTRAYSSRILVIRPRGPTAHPARGDANPTAQ